MGCTVQTRYSISTVQVLSQPRYVGTSVIGDGHCAPAAARAVGKFLCALSQESSLKEGIGLAKTAQVVRHKSTSSIRQRHSAIPALSRELGLLPGNSIPAPPTTSSE